MSTLALPQTTSGERNQSPSKRRGKRTRRLAKLGVADFETMKEARRRQKDLLQCLKRASVDPGRYAGLADCGSAGCGKVKCAEACYVGTRRRRLKEIPAAYRLLKGVGGPIFEVRVARASWARPVGDLRKVSIAAAKQLNRRALDALFNPALIALGTFKVFAFTGQATKKWVAEIHELVAGAEEADLTRVFSPPEQRGSKSEQYVRVKRVDNLAQAISDVLRRDLQSWSHPWHPQVVQDRPGKARRVEYYSWLLKLHVGDRMVRYGCDRYFNALKKRARIVRPKIRKKRPYPFWLEGHMFGQGKWDLMTGDQINQAINPNRPPAVDPGPDYYKDCNE